MVPGLITLNQKIMQGQCVECHDSGKINWQPNIKWVKGRVPVRMIALLRVMWAVVSPFFVIKEKDQSSTF